MSPNPRLKLDLDGGPLTVAVISPDPGLARDLRRAVRVRRDIVVVDGTRGADVLVWDTGDDGASSPLVVAGTATLALAEDSSTADRALAAGARGVVSREVGISGLIAAVIATRYGLSVRTPELAAPARATASLTEREHQVLELLARGLGNRAIAGELGISTHTAKFHVARLLDKLAAQTRTQAVLEGIRQGLIHL